MIKQGIADLPDGIRLDYYIPLVLGSCFEVIRFKILKPAVICNHSFKRPWKTGVKPGFGYFTPYRAKTKDHGTVSLSYLAGESKIAKHCYQYYGYCDLGDPERHGGSCCFFIFISRLCGDL